MRLLATSLSVLLVLVVSPFMTWHGCMLGSRIFENVMTVGLVLLFGVGAYTAKSNRRRWLITAIAPVVSFFATMKYFSFLHSKSFPERWLDPSALEWKAQMEHDRQEQTKSGN